MPIIMITAKGRERDIVRGLETGADDYVTNPFSMDILVARIRAFLRHHRSTDIGSFTFKDYILDRSPRRLTKNGKEVSLTSKEYRLLEYFLPNTDRAITRNQIMNQVWGNSIPVTQRSVDRYVKTLRAKIESDKSKPTHIITIRDVGYRFEK
ncbi:response regulator transcription factor [Puniceicoccaceae bacterium K14]|nr:response regulator transcription factor [Puniceicoccaceae bacterium K14]